MTKEIAHKHTQTRNGQATHIHSTKQPLCLAKSILITISNGLCWWKSRNGLLYKAWSFDTTNRNNNNNRWCWCCYSYRNHNNEQNGIYGPDQSVWSIFETVKRVSGPFHYYWRREMYLCCCCCCCWLNIRCMHRMLHVYEIKSNI